MNENLLPIIISSAAFVIAMITFFMVRNRKETPPPSDTFSSKPLQLQAYERITVLAERIAIPSLVSRASQQSNLSAREMQLLLLESVKQEYEYNASQQIYVTPVALEAVKNLKDQNMLIINQVGVTLPAEAGGIDLNKRLLEFMMASKKGALHEVVMEALNYEAKKVLKS